MDHTTVKPLYGRRQGAEIGYNPHSRSEAETACLTSTNKAGNPGRPSHVYHSYFAANLRLCVGVEVRPGNGHAAGHGQPGLWRTLEALPRSCRPAFIRGDSGYGQDVLMRECEIRGLPYVFKLRFTAKVRGLVALLQRSGGWQSAGDGWEVVESTLRLTGWSHARRALIVRESVARAPVPENPEHRVRPGPRRGKDRGLLPGATGPEWKSAAPWSGKLAVLVTSLDAGAYPAACIPRIYRERGDCENNYDELKNQWGWNGYTTQKLAPCRSWPT